MRDKNSSYSKFIQDVEKKVEIGLDKTNLQYSLQNPCLNKSDLAEYRIQNSDLVKILYPKDFRLTRTLCIIQWFLPEAFHWRIWLDLNERHFNEFNVLQRLEIKVILESKEICLKYLYHTDSLTGNQLFGNILGNDLKDLARTMILRVRTQLPDPKKVQRKRGYSDHGSMREIGTWLPDVSNDFTTLEYELEKENENLTLDKYYHTLIDSIEQTDYEKMNEVFSEVSSLTLTLET